MKTNSYRSALLLAFALFIVSGLMLSSCGKKKEDPFATDETTEKKDGGGATEALGDATVTGKVVLDGAAPAAAAVKQDSDPICAAAASSLGAELTQEVAVKDGKLANVFVYVSGGLEGKTFEPPAAAAEIDQQGCRYHPHVLGVMVGQKLKIKNSDATMHNVHATPATNAGFNMAQPTKGAENEKSFDKEEIMIPVSCDVHGWMRSYIGVLPHPFFGVSGTDGAFSLKNLPAGKYKITAWHEKLGKSEQEVTVAAKETKDITFTFKAQ